MNDPGINMPAVLLLLQKKWLTIVGFTIFAALLATLVVFIVPKQYRSSAKIVSANTVMADKANLFNNNIQQLYSYFGSGDDLDRIQGIAMLDTSMLQLVDSFQLVSYYELNGTDTARLRNKAVKLLREDLFFKRTPEGQLLMEVWTRDRWLSAAIINQLLRIINRHASGIWRANYERNRQELELSIQKAEQDYQQLYDSIPKTNSKQFALVQTHMQTLLDQLKNYRASAAAFKLMERSIPPVMYVLEPAVPAARSERPNKPLLIAAAALAGCLLSILWLLFTSAKQRD